jgi:hypothetical protein
MHFHTSDCHNVRELLMLELPKTADRKVLATTPEKGIKWHQK